MLLREFSKHTIGSYSETIYLVNIYMFVIHVSLFLDHIHILGLHMFLFLPQYDLDLWPILVSFLFILKKQLDVKKNGLVRFKEGENN